MASRRRTKDVERLLREAGGTLSSGMHGPDCLSVEKLARFCEGGLDQQERGRVVAHLEACRACLEEVCLCVREIAVKEPGEAALHLSGHARGAGVPTGCIPFLDLHKHVVGSAALSESQRVHLGSCRACARLRDSIRLTLAERGVLGEELQGIVGGLIEEFIVESQSRLLAYVDVVQAVVRKIVAGPRASHPDKWRIARRPQLQGALAIAGLPESEQLALLASALTIAAVVVSMGGLQITEDPASLEATIRRFARRFRAGRELTDGLVRFLQARLGAQSARTPNGK